MTAPCFRVERVGNGFTLSVDQKSEYDGDRPAPYKPPKVTVYKTKTELLEAVREVIEA